MGDHIDIVFDGPPGPEAGRFVEVENSRGQSISFGEWVEREDGYWVLRIPSPDLMEALDTIAGGHTDRFPGAPDIFTSSPDEFRHGMWTWSQRVARAAISRATSPRPA